MLPQEPLAVSRAQALAHACQSARVPAKLLGGTAIFLLSPTVRSAPFQRPYSDIDLAIPGRHSAGLKDILVKELDLTPDRAFNATHGERRQLYRWPDGMELDVFVNVFEQCQQLDLKPWLKQSDAATLPRAVLLLTKLQVVRINAKDISDVAALILDNPTIFEDTEISDLLSRSWRWYVTVVDTLSTIRSRFPELLNTTQVALVNETLDRATQHLEHSPKSLLWKSRALMGKRLPWYELPEEK